MIQAGAGADRSRVGGGDNTTSGEVVHTATVASNQCLRAVAVLASHARPLFFMMKRAFLPTKNGENSSYRNKNRTPENKEQFWRVDDWGVIWRAGN